MPRLLYRDRRAIQRGRAEGRLETAREYILEALEARFGELPPSIGAALECLVRSSQADGLEA